MPRIKTGVIRGGQFRALPPSQFRTAEEESALRLSKSRETTEKLRQAAMVTKLTKAGIDLFGPAIAGGISRLAETDIETQRAELAEDARMKAADTATDRITGEQEQRHVARERGLLDKARADFRGAVGSQLNEQVEQDEARRTMPSTTQETPTRVLGQTGVAPASGRAPVETPRNKALRHLDGLGRKLKNARTPEEADKINRAIKMVKQRFERDSLNARLPTASDKDLEAMAEKLQARNPAPGSRSEAALIKILEEQERRAPVHLPGDVDDGTIIQPLVPKQVGPGTPGVAGQAPLVGSAGGRPVAASAQSIAQPQPFPQVGAGTPGTQGQAALPAQVGGAPSPAVSQAQAQGFTPEPGRTQTDSELAGQDYMREVARLKGLVADGTATPEDRDELKRLQPTDPYFDDKPARKQAMDTAAKLAGKMVRGETLTSAEVDELNKSNALLTGVKDELVVATAPEAPVPDSVASGKPTAAPAEVERRSLSIAELVRAGARDVALAEAAAKKDAKTAVMDLEEASALIASDPSKRAQAMAALKRGGYVGVRARNFTDLISGAHIQKANLALGKLGGKAKSAEQLELEKIRLETARTRRDTAKESRSRATKREDRAAAKSKRAITKEKIKAERDAALAPLKQQKAESDAAAAKARKILLNAKTTPKALRRLARDEANRSASLRARAAKAKEAARVAKDPKVGTMAMARARLAALQARKAAANAAKAKKKADHGVTPLQFHRALSAAERTEVAAKVRKINALKTSVKAHEKLKTTDNWNYSMEATAKAAAVRENTKTLNAIKELEGEIAEINKAAKKRAKGLTPKRGVEMPSTATETGDSGGGSGDSGGSLTDAQIKAMAEKAAGK